MQIELPSAEATLRAGHALGAAIASCDALVVVGLSGELGAGKTSFVSGVLSAFSVHQGVRSPTYTLIEPYERGERTIYHLDLYRLRAEDELEDLGIRELLAPPNVLLIEWIERSDALNTAQDLHVTLAYPADGVAGRCLSLEPRTAIGELLNREWLRALSQE